MKATNKLFMDSACRIAEEINAKAILLYADLTSELPITNDEYPCYDLILVTKGDEKTDETLGNIVKIINVPNVNLTRIGQIKIAITKGIATGLFKRGDKLVCLGGVTKFGYIDSLFMIDVGKEFEILTLENITDITDGLYPEVFGTIMNITLELAAQGREGRKTGTIFVIGDHESVLRLSRQMVINPFLGYREEDRNVLNPELKETLKEFSAIDGAFVVKENGIVLAAGRHLNAALESKDFPRGLGSRHIAAAGITSVTKAIAIVLSESTGNVTVFKNGRIFVRIEKPVD